VSPLLHHRLHPEQVDHAAELRLLPDRQLHGTAGTFRMSAISSTAFAGSAARGPSSKRRRSPARRPPREAPHLLGLDLHAGDGVDEEDRAVEHFEAGPGVRLEVDVAGGVGERDLDLVQA